MDCIIYKIEDNTDHRLYIGSTTQDLKTRLKQHEFYKKYSSYEIIQNGDYIIAEIERCDSENRRYREQFWIDNTDCVNKQRALTTTEQRKEQKKNFQKKYREKNKEQVNDYRLKLFHYQNSWGGDKRYNNNLLRIDVNYFF